MVANVRIKQPIKPKKRHYTEEDIINHVQNHGRLISPRKGLYGVSFNGHAYVKKDTRDLVIAICKDNGMRCEP